MAHPGISRRNRSMRGTADATSPTDTACNQMDPVFVRVNIRGRKPRRSAKCVLYSRLLMSRAAK